MTFSYSVSQEQISSENMKTEHMVRPVSDYENKRYNGDTGKLLAVDFSNDFAFVTFITVEFQITFLLSLYLDLVACINS